MQGKRSVTSIHYPRWLERPVLHRQRETALRQGYMMSCNKPLVGVFFSDFDAPSLTFAACKGYALALEQRPQDQ